MSLNKTYQDNFILAFKSNVIQQSYASYVWILEQVPGPNACF